jgi:hypothetical protein
MNAFLSITDFLFNSYSTFGDIAFGTLRCQSKNALTPKKVRENNDLTGGVSLPKLFLSAAYLLRRL